MLEAHYYYRDLVKLANNKYKFFCKYCNKDYKDKSSLSYHRYKNKCSAWKGRGILKMYPCFAKSDQHTVNEIMDKAGLIFPPPGGEKASKRHASGEVQEKAKHRRTSVAEVLARPLSSKHHSEGSRG